MNVKKSVKQKMENVSLGNWWEVIKGTDIDALGRQEITKWQFQGYQGGDWLVDLNDIVPLIDRPDTVVLHVGWWALPVPHLDGNLPVWPVVGFNILKGFTGNMYLEFYEFSPAQSKLWKEIPAPQKKMVTSRRLKDTSQQVHRESKQLQWEVKLHL